MESQSSLTEVGVATVVPAVPTDDQSELQRLEDDVCETSKPEYSDTAKETVERSSAKLTNKSMPFKHLGLLRSSESWKLNYFLSELGSLISQDELHKLKHLFVGRYLH